MNLVPKYSLYWIALSLSACGGGSSNTTSTPSGGLMPLNPPATSTVVAVVPAASAPADTTAPTAPAGLTLARSSASTLSIRWTASTDNVAVTRYEIYIGPTLVATTNQTSIDLSGLSPNTTYAVNIKAFDFAENASAASGMLTASTASESPSVAAPVVTPPTVTAPAVADTTPPTAPSNLVASNFNSNSLTLSWTASTDNVAVTRYDVFKDGVLAGSATTNTMTLSGLTASTTYGLSVKASDAAGGMSPASPTLQASTSAIVPNAVLRRHGDSVELTGNYGDNNVTHTFLGGMNGLIDSKSIGQTMTNGAGWTFNNLGGPTTVALDAKRGKVLFTPENDQQYNAVRRYDPGFAITEQRYFYKAHWVRNVMRLDGQPYTKSYQWKHERVSWQNSVTDTDTEIKVHQWPNYPNAGVMTFVNRSASDQSVYYGGKAADANSDWALMEMMVFTGTQGLQDGKMITRVHKNGKTWISQNKQTERIYTEPTLRLRYFVEQNYFGNFAQAESGVDNGLPAPQVRELYSDDSRVIVGNVANSGWKRVELRDKPALSDASIRALQDWTAWNTNITVRLNTKGLPSGDLDMYLVVIDGVDANGWDNVVSATPVKVHVD